MTDSLVETPSPAPESLRHKVRSAVIWRTGTQIAGQVLTWASTFVVIRVLDPSDYGLFAMTQVVLVLLNLLNGYGLASALIQRKEAGRTAQRQLFGMLLILNLGLGAAQFLLAPLIADYYRQPMVADLLRWQSLLYVATPFMALPYAMLSRELEFKKQAQVNFVSGLAGAGAALIGAHNGMGVWTLIVAPMVLFGTRAIGMTWAARSLMWPSFDFRGAGDMARFGAVMASTQIFWFLQSQSDVFIAGRTFDPHWLGIYTTSLFLAQIFVSKFVPPLNEIAFSAYSRLRDDQVAVRKAFLTSVKLIMVVALPFYFGLAATAEPLVATVLGDKWLEAIPVVRFIALIMPLMTLQVLYAPATDACGRPGIGAQNAMVGAILLPICFLIGVHWGLYGLIAGWFVAYPIFLTITTRRTLPILQIKVGAMIGSFLPALILSILMGGVVAGADLLSPLTSPFARLILLTGLGAAIYLGGMAIFARDTVREVIELVRNRGA